MREACKKIYMNEGFGGFLKGLKPTLFRTFIVNMITLPCFDKIN